MQYITFEFKIFKIKFFIHVMKRDQNDTFKEICFIYFGSKLEPEGLHELMF